MIAVPAGAFADPMSLPPRSSVYEAATLAPLSVRKLPAAPVPPVLPWRAGRRSTVSLSADPQLVGGNAQHPQCPLWVLRETVLLPPALRPGSHDAHPETLYDLKAPHRQSQLSDLEILNLCRG